MTSSSCATYVAASTAVRVGALGANNDIDKAALLVPELVVKRLIPVVSKWMASKGRKCHLWLLWKKGATHG